ncbi:hypothetical protein [uncultured Mediterranean phage uvDeep-CGR2-AD12-C183]|nr:hypothetical protein [uncultured Mediterranean phage uvDeep-CGR2-AD12-C183]
MSAGSAFASGVRAGQNIWNSAVQNAMAGKRMDMLKTQFQFEQTQRKKALDDQLSSSSTYDKFTEYLADATASGEINFSTPEGREHYSNLKTSVEPTISRDPATWKRYEAFSKTFEEKEGFPVFKEQERKILGIGITWDQNNPGMPRPQVINEKTGESVDNTNQMEEDNFNKAFERKRREAQIKYGTIGDAVEAGVDPSDVPPELRMALIRGRKESWDEAVESGDTDTLIQASKVWKTRPTATEIQSMEKFKFTLDRLGELKDALEGEATGPIWGIVRSNNPFDEKARLIKAQITKIIPGLARGVFGEVGVLTDPDVRMYSQTIGNLTTPEEVNNALTAMAIDMVSTGFENKLRTAAMSRANVSAFYPQLQEIRAQRDKLLGVEEEAPTIPIIDVENLPQSGAVTLTDDQAAAARAAADENGLVRVREAGTDVIRQINVNPPTEETVEETISAPVKPDPTGFDWGWAAGVAEEPEKAEAPKSDSERRSQIERRIEFLEESLEAEQNKRKRGGTLRGRETAAEKRIKKSILDNKETLKNL